MKSVGIILLLIYLVSIQTPLAEFYRIPNLIEHFKKHREATGISLVEFLKLHYATDHQDTDYEEDETLPFMSTNIYFIGIALVSPAIQDVNPVPAYFENPRSSYLVPIVRKYLPGVFHPPR